MALPGMEVLQNRIDSFEPRRLKKGGKLYIWPHDDSFIASKSNLAEAGFYFSPTPKKEDFDNVTCFMCQKQLGDWEKEDDPFALHFAKCAEKCAWANLRCGLQYDRVEGGGFKFAKNRVPTSEAAEKTRLKTFQGWPHDANRHHTASSVNMAKAGFVYTPAEVGDDEVTCLFCAVSLSGWQDGDDAWEEHKKRSKRACPLFASGPSSKSHHEEHSIPVKSQDGDADELGRSTAQKTPRRQTKKTTGAKTPAAKGRSKSKPPPVQDVDEDEDVEPEQSKPAPPIKQKRQTRQISVKRSQTKSDEERAEESEVMSLAVEYQDPGSSVASKKAAGKRKPKATEQHPRPESDMEEQSAFHPSQSTTSNPRSGSTRPTRTIVRSEDEAQAAVTEDEPVTAAMPPPKSHNRTRSTSAMSAVDPPPRPPKSPSRRLGKAKGKLPPSDVSDDDEETPTPLPVAKPKSTRTRSQSRAPSESESERPARLTRKGSKAKVASDAEDAEDEPARKRKTVTRKASKAKAIVADTEEDNEADSSTSAASKAKLSKSKGKSSELLSAIAKATAHVPSPVKEVDEEDLSMNIHIPPPSPSPMPKPKPSAIKRAPSFVDLAELSKPKAKSQKKTADFIPTKSASKPIKQTPQDFFGASQLADHSQESKRGAETSDEEPPQKRVAKPPLPMAHEEKQITRESALRVVDISSDEDSPMKPQAKPKKHLPQPSPPRVAPETMTEPSILDEDIEIPVELPQTPPRRAAPVILPSSPMAVEADIERAPFPSTPATRTDPEFYPPLSTEPYVNATSFTDDELDMTVEDWILQQVEQQLTKFKLDGEIFLQQIEKEAESKRMAIEALN